MLPCRELGAGEAQGWDQDWEEEGIGETNMSALACQLLSLPKWASALHSRSCHGPYNSSHLGAEIMLQQTEFSSGIFLKCCVRERTLILRLSHHPHFTSSLPSAHSLLHTRTRVCARSLSLFQGRHSSPKSSVRLPCSSQTNTRAKRAEVLPRASLCAC
jgi:hypothetical protein